MADAELIPIDKIVEPRDLGTLGAEVNALVQRDDVQKNLRVRHLPGVLARHSGETSESTKSIFNARQKHYAGELGIFVLRDASGDLLGMGTIYPNLELKHQKTNIAPRLALGPRSKRVPIQGPEVTVWTIPNDEGFAALAGAYKALTSSDYLPAARYLLPANPGHPVRPWTIEPVNSPIEIHEGIKSAGFVVIDTGFYDDQESRKLTLPRSQLYEKQKV